MSLQPPVTGRVNGLPPVQSGKSRPEPFDADDFTYGFGPAIAREKPRNPAGLTVDEACLLDLTGRLWNEYLALPREHSSDMEEFRHKLHDLQRMILCRPARRALPEISGQ